jgi:hypothetical protein
MRLRRSVCGGGQGCDFEAQSLSKAKELKD